MAASLQRKAAATWPEVDAEITCSEDGGRSQALLRIASLKGASATFTEGEIRRARQVVSWFERELGEATGKVPRLRLCPRPRPFTDHRAPRLSHYEGTTWVYELG